MSRFLWLIRREVWEHKAIWVAPAIVIGCLVLLMLTGNVHLGPISATGGEAQFAQMPQDLQVKLLVIIYGGLALVVFMVMGIVGFFYALDSLYADRRDRSVLFWKSLPLSDAETVLSKFAVAIVVIPLVALAASLVAQLLIAAGGSARLAIGGMPADGLWRPEVLFGGFAIAFLWCVTAVLWYSPIVGYLMLASAWAPRGPFLWAVLPAVGLWIGERVIVGSTYVGDFITDRLLRPLPCPRVAGRARPRRRRRTREVAHHGPRCEPARLLHVARALGRRAGGGAPAARRDVGPPLPRRDELKEGNVPSC